MDSANPDSLQAKDGPPGEAAALNPLWNPGPQQWQDIFNASICNRVDHIIIQLQQLLSLLADPATPSVTVDTV